MNNIQSIYNEIKHSSLIRLSDSAPQLKEYLNKYFPTYDLNEQEINDLFELVEEPFKAFEESISISSPVMSEVRENIRKEAVTKIKAKRKSRAKTQKLVAA